MATVGESSARVRAHRRRAQTGYFALLLPLLIYLGAFYAYPVAAMMFRSIHEPRWTADNFVQIFETGVYLHVLWLTVRISLIVTVVSLVLGYPVAYVLARVDRAKSNLLMILVLVPFWTSILVRTYAWMVLLGQQGIINQLLLSLGVIDEPVRLLNTTFAVYVAMVHVLLPFMILPLYSVMAGIDGGLLIAARSLGARPVQVFLRIFLPLSLPGVHAGCLLVFLSSVGYYITPALLGGPRQITTAMLIDLMVNDLLNWGFGATLAIPLLTTVVVLLVVVTSALGLGRILRPASAA